jgi:hypothetical protein
MLVIKIIISSIKVNPLSLLIILNFVTTQDRCQYLYRVQGSVNQTIHSGTPLNSKDTCPRYAKRGGQEGVLPYIGQDKADFPLMI